MIYQVGKKHCLNSGQNQNDYINPLESDLIVQPPSPLEFPGPLAPLPPGISKRGGGLDIFCTHTIGDKISWQLRHCTLN